MLLLRGLPRTDTSGITTFENIDGLLRNSEIRRTSRPLQRAGRRIVDSILRASLAQSSRNIEGKYNTRRLHWTLGYLSPAQHDAAHRNPDAQASLSTQATCPSKRTKSSCFIGAVLLAHLGASDSHTWWVNSGEPVNGNTRTGDVTDNRVCVKPEPIHRN